MKPVRLSSLEALQTWGARGEASVSASACHRARPRTERVLVIGTPSVTLALRACTTITVLRPRT